MSSPDRLPRLIRKQVPNDGDGKRRLELGIGPAILKGLAKMQAGMTN